MTSDGRLLQALLRNEFRVFVEKVFMTLTPGANARAPTPTDKLSTICLSVRQLTPFVLFAYQSPD
jgi:hypothetical protein